MTEDTVFLRINIPQGDHEFGDNEYDDKAKLMRQPACKEQHVFSFLCASILLFSGYLLMARLYP
jgi:hypothetical protein